MSSSLSDTFSSEDKPVMVLWGCELNSTIRRCVVKEEDDLLEHLVYLKTMSLGEDATDEPHVVAVESKNMASAPRPVPIASLRHSVLPMVCLDGFEFIPPVTFILKSGTGPVYLNGQHLILEDFSNYGTPENAYQPPQEASEAFSHIGGYPVDPKDLEEDSQIPPPPDTAPPGVAPPEGVPPEGMPPEGVPPEGIPPEGMPPEGVPPEGMPPEGVPPEGMPPEDGPPEGMPPEGMPPEGMPPEGMPQEAMPPESPQSEEVSE